MAKKKIYKHHERTTLALAATDAQQREMVLGNAEKQAAIPFNDAGILSWPGYIEVTAYGAKGDGTTDDTAAIRTALAAAQSLGRDLYFPKGSYKVNAPLATPLYFNTDGPDVTVIMETGATISGTVGAYSYLYFKKFRASRSSVFLTYTSVEISAPVDGIYPEWWGAKPDNSTDCSTALILAVYAASPPGINPGTVHFGPGIYKLGQDCDLYATGRYYNLLFDAGAMIAGNGYVFKTAGGLQAPLTKIFVNPSYADSFGTPVVNGLTVRLVNCDVIHVEWFGAAINILTDDRGPLQAALDAAQYTNGAIVEIPADRIIALNNTVGVRTNVTLRGRGRGTGAIRSTIGGGLNTLEIATGANVRICDLRIMHADISSSGAAIRTGSLTLGALITTPPERVTIERVQIENHSIGISCAQSSNFTTILDAYFLSCYTGIALADSASVHIARVLFDSCSTKDITIAATVTKTLLVDLRARTGTLNFTDSATDTQWITEERLKFYRSIGFFGTTPQSQQSGNSDPRNILTTYGLTSSATQTQRTPGIMLTQTGDQTIANTAVESGLTGTLVGSSTVRSAYFRAGLTIRTHIRGFLSNTGTPTIRLKQKLGSIIVFDTGAITMSSVASSTEFEFFITTTIRTTGASGTARSQGYFRYGNTIVSGPAQTADVTVDTTADRIISPSVQWGTANALNTITVTNMVHELLN